MSAPTQPAKLGFFEAVMLWLLSIAALSFVCLAAGAAVGCFVVGFRMVTQ